MLCVLGVTCTITFEDWSSPCKWAKNNAIEVERKRGSDWVVVNKIISACTTALGAGPHNDEQACGYRGGDIGGRVDWEGKWGEILGVADTDLCLVDFGIWI